MRLWEVPGLSLNVDKNEKKKKNIYLSKKDMFGSSFLKLFFILKIKQ